MLRLEQKSSETKEQKLNLILLVRCIDLYLDRIRNAKILENFEVSAEKNLCLYWFQNLFIQTVLRIGQIHELLLFIISYIAAYFLLILSNIRFLFVLRTNILGENSSLLI